MKRVIALLTALVCAALILAAQAEAAAPSAPLLRLYRAERTLLFATGNVTMTGTAVFTADGCRFKTAELMHIQDGLASVRDWRLLTPRPLGDDRETGYTVVCAEDRVDAFESYCHDHKRYSVEPDRQRNSILRRTVTADTLAEMAELLLAQCGDIGQCTAAANADGTIALSLHMTAEDVPPYLNPLLNSVLQYGITRYYGYDYFTDSEVGWATYDSYVTVSEGLVFCLKAVRLRELTVDALLDEQDRIRQVTGSVVLDYEDKLGGKVSELRLEFEQNAFNYGDSRVDADPAAYDHWGTAQAASAAPGDTVPRYDPTWEREAVRRLLGGLYLNPQGGSLLHVDSHCPTVSSDYLPLDRAELTPDLLLEYPLCRFCVDASPFLDENSSASLDAAAAELMASMTYGKDYGLNELYWDLDAKYGLFENWSYAQKNRFTAMLPTLALREEERMIQYHPSLAPNTRLREMLGIWSYGLPPQGADVSVLKAAEACALTQGLLTEEQLDTLTVTCDYCTGSSYVRPFRRPWWIVRYSDKSQPVCEVWVDSVLGAAHGLDTRRAMDAALAALMTSQPQLGGKPVSPDMFLAFGYHVVYQPDEGQWCCVFDTWTGACWYVYLNDDADLSVASTEGSNG